MTVQRSHGRPYPLVSPLDELPAGTPAPAEPPITRDEVGRVQAGAAARALGRRGGLATGHARALGRLLGLDTLPENHPYLPYTRLAREWRDDHMRQLADTIGGGEVGPGPASIVSTAALQLAASRYLTDLGARAGDAKMLLDGSRLADSSRQNLLAAHELVAREAAAARTRAAQSPHADVLEAFGEPTDGSARK